MSVADYLFNLTQFSTYGDAAASVGVLSGLHYPDALAHVRILCQVRVVHGVVVGFFKFAELTVCNAILYVESKGQVVKDILVDGIIVYLHVVVDRLLIRQMIVVFLMIGSCETMTSMVLFLWLF